MASNKVEISVTENGGGYEAGCDNPNAKTKTGPDNKRTVDISIKSGEPWEFDTSPSAPTHTYRGETLTCRGPAFWVNDPDGDLEARLVGGQKLKVEATAANPTLLDYRYVVKLQQIGDPAVKCELDPFIRDAGG